MENIEQQEGDITQIQVTLEELYYNSILTFVFLKKTSKLVKRVVDAKKGIETVTMNCATATL